MKYKERVLNITIMDQVFIGVISYLGIWYIPSLREIAERTLSGKMDMMAHSILCVIIIIISIILRIKK